MFRKPYYGSKIAPACAYWLCPKLDYFLSQGKATVVYPVPAKKTVVWISPEGDMTPPRKSPLKPTAGQVLPELDPKDFTLD